MMHKSIFLIICAMHCIVVGNIPQNEVISVDFYESMQAMSFEYVWQVPHIQLLNFFKKMYDKYIPASMVVHEQPLIPKKFHWIWLGGKHPERHKLPKYYRAWQQTWLTLHPNFEFYVWTEADVETFAWENRDLFDEAKNYGQKSDIWRYEILYKFGGVYLDVDMVCLKSIECLLHMYHFLIGIQALDTNIVQLGIGIIGAMPAHPLLHICVEQLRYNQHIQQIIVKTGPIHFTRCFVQYIGTSNLYDIALPASFFYSCGYTQKDLDVSVWQKPESYAAHMWEASWLKPEAMIQ